jgi:N-ethylmaleimide reductase
MANITLFTPGRINGFDTRNRIVMAPMTRSRSDPGAMPSDMAVIYYGQRASAGLIVTEGTAPSAAGLGYVRTPSIHTDAHVGAWKKITEAVHARGTKIFLQLMHVGRIGHAANRLSADPLVAPSAIRPAGHIVTPSGLQDFETPRALETSEIPGVIREYGDATRRAMHAGFDGVELHCGSGYLPMQFLSSGTNKRTDNYGGSLQNRLRFVLEVLEEMAHAAGSASRVSMKISPAIPFNDISDDDPVESHVALAQAISPMGLAFLQIVKTPPLPNILEILRPAYTGTVVAIGGFDQQTGNAALAAGLADFIGFGKLFIANPDLPQRFAKGHPLNPWNAATFYTAGAEGYIDYAPFEAAAS